MKFQISISKENKSTELININKNLGIKDKFKNTIHDLRVKHQELKEIQELNDKWLQVMAHCNAYNAEFKTFTLTYIVKEMYGFSCMVFVPYGLSFSKIEALRETIEESLNCIFLFKREKGKNCIKAKFITNGFNVGNYFPVKVKPYELYIGNGYDGMPVVVSMLDFPHVLLSGANNSGKTRCLDCALTTLIHHCTKEELELYLVQIAKSDLIIYEDAEQTKAFADTLSKTAEVLGHILGEMEARDKLIRPLKKAGRGSNISDYNKLNPDKKLPYCFVTFDEMSSLFDVSGNDKETIKLKKDIINMLEQVWQYGRALGIYGIACTQRPTADKLSPYVKSQSNLMISFKQNNQKSSEVAINDSSIALCLPARVAVYLTTEYDYLKTPFITDKIIIKYIKNKLAPYHKNLFTPDVKVTDGKAGNKSNKDIVKGGKTKC
jgi:S-DNA-T family DNA segregation ATPase FtsK/SpoIIIE